MGVATNPHLPEHNCTVLQLSYVKYQKQALFVVVATKLFYGVEKGKACYVKGCCV